jgi:peptidyl-prolyl cis-trans isomerase SurA
MKPVSLILAVAFLTLAPFVSRAEVTDRIIAIVNDDIVTLREVEKFVAVEKKSRYSSMNEYTRNLQLREKLDQFIEGLLIAQQGKKLKVEVTDKDVQETIDNIKKQNLVTDAQLKQQLSQEHIDYRDFIAGIKRNITRTKVLAKAIMQEMDLNDKTLKAYYDAHVGDYVQEEYRLQQVFVSSQRKDAAGRVQQALHALDQDRPFGEVAREFSDDASSTMDGDMGFVKKEDLIPELREAVKLLIPGTYSNVVRTSFGFHILKLTETRKSPAASFESVKNSVRENLFVIESEKRYKTYIAKLRSSSYIEVKI